MRNDNIKLSDINLPYTKSIFDQYGGNLRVTFCDHYNDEEQMLFNLTDKVYLSKNDENSLLIDKVTRKYTWDWTKDYDNGTNYDFPNELMTFHTNEYGDCIATLSKLYLDRPDKEIPTVKYSYFFFKGTELNLTVPNQGDDGNCIAYVNENGELIIDNDQH